MLLQIVKGRNPKQQKNKKKNEASGSGSSVSIKSISIFEEEKSGTVDRTVSVLYEHLVFLLFKGRWRWLTTTGEPKASISKNQWLRWGVQVIGAPILKYTTLQLFPFLALLADLPQMTVALTWADRVVNKPPGFVRRPSAENSEESPGASFHSLQLPGSMHNIADLPFVLRRCHRRAGLK